jgi:predicted nucleic acid-binding protein
VRVVLDTNILVRANPKTNPIGLAKELLLKIVTSPHMLVLSPAILAEAGRVLRYSHVQERWPLSDEAIQTGRDSLSRNFFLASQKMKSRTVLSCAWEQEILARGGSARSAPPPLPQIPR